MRQSGDEEQEQVSREATQGSRLYETAYLSTMDSQVNEYHRGDRPRERKWLVLGVLLLCIVVSHAPLVYGHFAFVEGGISKNNIMIIMVLPFLFLILMVSSIVTIHRLLNCCNPFSITWFGEKKRSDVLGVVVLSIMVLVVNAILWQVFERLHVPMRGSMIISITYPGIVLLSLQTLRIVLLTPIVEEIFWRGYAQDVLQRTFYQPLGLFAQAVLFAFVHMMDLPGRLSIFFLGLIFGIWRYRKRSLVPLVIAHMVVNAMYCVRFWQDHLELRMVRITHDYRAPLEQLCKPLDNIPNENAMPHYTRAFELLVEKSKELDEADLKAWPINLSHEKISLLLNWISSNKQAIAEFEIGAKKPYYCREYSKESFGDIILPPLSKARQLVLVVLSRAKMSAIEGNFQQSFSSIITCYRFGQQLAGPKPVAEQLVGLAVKERTIEETYQILKRTRIDDTYLKALQYGLEAVSDKSVAPINFSGERLICHDLIQRNFTDDGTGGGQIPRIVIEHMRNPSLYLRRQGIPLLREDQALAWEKLERRQTIRLTDEVFAHLASIKGRNPAELHRSGRDVEDIIRQSTKDNVFLLAIIQAYTEAYHKSYRCKARKDALNVTVAIIRYRLEQGDPPDELTQLIQAGYLDSLPLDPYSDAPFIYNKLDSDFLLYSLGPDFDNNGGTRSIENGDIAGGDDVFWPLEDN